MKNRTIGLLAHVDAGKTTLAEAMLFEAGMLRKLGRVDHRDTYLDTHEIERERGITIFSKQAVFEYGDKRFFLLDTPGHTDFSAEAERVLPILDCAVLVLNGAEGVQAHTDTLWSLLEKYRIPTILFFTKMDLGRLSREQLIEGVRERLSPHCFDFSPGGSTEEDLAVSDEEALECYLSSGSLPDEQVRRLVNERKLFPCFFGSGLRLDGVRAFLDRFSEIVPEPVYPESFSARVFQIRREESGKRLTYLKVTGGTLRTRQTISFRTENENGEPTPVEEKITEIRRYSGNRFEAVPEAEAGEVCAVVGPDRTFAGLWIGSAETVGSKAVLEPVLSYRIEFQDDTDPRVAFLTLKLLEEEEPLLDLVWDERRGEIHADLMGSVQTEVLTQLIADRFGYEVRFTDRHYLYRETIAAPVEGVGHYEPLRHYAEVHVLIEPLPRGSGIEYACDCSADILPFVYQKAVMSQLSEKRHRGVLTGSLLTDVRITLKSGRAHIKHTEGGDFREAAFRAVRQGLMQARKASGCVLLEPLCRFRLELPSEYLGRAISDLLQRNGDCAEQEMSGANVVLTGTVPAAAVGDYPLMVAAYTHGAGRLSLRFNGYTECKDAEEVIRRFHYDPEADLENTPDSVFCSHGAGFTVKWHEVPDYMHLASIFGKSPETGADPVLHRNLDLDDRELEAIMEREFGPIRRKSYTEPVRRTSFAEQSWPDRADTVYIVDGYNVIYAWDEFQKMAEEDFENAREKFLDLLVNFHSFTGRRLIVVFDAYHVKGGTDRTFDLHGIRVVFTKEGELGDTYIERLVQQIGKNESVRVVTSDGLIQLQALRTGVFRMSAREFRDEVLTADRRIGEILEKLTENASNTPKL